MDRLRAIALVASLFIFGLAVLLLLCGCVPYSKGRVLVYNNNPAHTKTWKWNVEKGPIIWTFACGFSSKFRDEVRKGFKYWDDMTDVTLFYELLRCAPKEFNWIKSNITIVTIKNMYVIRDSSILGTAYRNVTKNSRVIKSGKIRFWRPWITTTDYVRRVVVRHEIGHILGFHHVDFKDCVMHPHAMTVDACDVEIKEFKRIYGRR